MFRPSYLPVPHQTYIDDGEGDQGNDNLTHLHRPDQVLPLERDTIWQFQIRTLLGTTLMLSSPPLPQDRNLRY